MNFSENEFLRKYHTSSFLAYGEVGKRVLKSVLSLLTYVQIMVLIGPFLLKTMRTIEDKNIPSWREKALIQV